MRDALVGRVLKNRYRLISRLAEGGMGITYRAWDARFSLPVAVKFPRVEHQQPEHVLQALLARFTREIETMSNLSHDHIVPIADHGCDGDLPFVVMRFLPGGSLADIRAKADLEGHRPASPSTLHFWLPAIADALDYMHSRGVLHRDIKLANIYFDGFRNAFLGDFGIAKVIDDSDIAHSEDALTATRMAVGTPDYMAPETFSPGHVPDGRSDQYSLAVCVYELLSGSKPFKGKSAHILVEHATLPVPPLGQQVAGLPRSLVAAVEKALNKHPSHRFESCAEFSRCVLADVPFAPFDQTLVRLLCPGCRTLLRVPRQAGGYRGTCRSCHEKLEIAADFSALWLAEEAQGTIGGDWGAGGQPSPDLGEPEISEPSSVKPRPLALVNDQLTAGHHKIIAWAIGSFFVGTIASSVLTGYMGWAWHKRQIQELLAQHRLADEQTLLRHSSREAEWRAAESRLIKQWEDRLAESTRLWQEKLGESQSQPDTSPNKLEPEGRSVGESGGLAPADGNGGEKPKGNPIATISPFETIKPGEPKIDSSSIVRLTVGLAQSLIEQCRADKSQGRPTALPLVLSSVETLSPPEASILAQHKGDLYLDGLPTLGLENAEQLSGHRALLSLCGLQDISAAEVEELTKKRKGELRLKGIRRLHPEVARVLAGHSGALDISGVQELPDDVAKELGKYKGQSILLDGVTQLSRSQARAIASCEGLLSLNGIQISNGPQRAGELVAVLSRHTGGLSLGGIKALSPGELAAIRQHRIHDVRFNGLTELSIEQAAVLSETLYRVELDGLADLTPATARELSRYAHGLISLNGLAHLPLGVAIALSEGHEDFLPVWLPEGQQDALRREDCWLHLNSLKEISPDAVAALAERGGWSLMLNGVASVSDELGEALLKQHRKVELRGVVTISEEMKRQLKAHQGITLPLEAK
jgi:hypothetical protein